MNETITYVNFTSSYLSAALIAIVQSIIFHNGFLQSKRDKKQKGSNNQKRLSKQIARKHEKITNIRRDNQHKVANKLIKEYDVIYAEDLDVARMLQGKNKVAANSNISDAALSQFIQILSYKAESAGKEFYAVEPAGTSCTCSRCGNKEKLSLEERTFRCSKCGLVLDRDTNAARNIKQRGSLKRAKKLVAGNAAATSSNMLVSKVA